MVRGGKAVFKRAAGRKKDYGDDDEEYVAEEDSSYESSYSSTPNEESLDASDAYESSSSASTEEKISNSKVSKVKYQRGYSFNHRSSSDSDYDEWNDDDEDFSPDDNDEEDWEEDSFVLGDVGASARKGATKRGGTKPKRKFSKPKSNKRSRKVASATGKRKRRRTGASSEDEDNFTENGRKSHIKYSKKVSKRMTKSIPSKKKKLSIEADLFDPDHLKVRAVVKNSRNNAKGNSRRNKISKMDSETSDSDFVVSEEDLFDNDFTELAKPRKYSREVRKIARTSRKQLPVESKRADSVDDILEDELNDLEIDKNLNILKFEGVSAGKKGKVKEAGDSGKQLCGICLSEEHKRTIQGILNCCSHYFCFACIMEWSKVESRCPLCKRRFVNITKTLRPDSALEMKRHVIRVQKRDQVYQPSEEELSVLLDPYENVVCMECHLGGDDNLMLLCDICDSSAHTYCVGLGKEVPDGNWYCDCCKFAGEGSLFSQVLDTHRASSSLMCHSDVEEKASNPQSSSIPQRSISLQGQPSSLGPDLNAPPTNFMEGTAVSVPSASGTGASTLYARRAIHHRIRVIISNARPRQPHSESIRADIDSQTEAVHSSVLEQNGVQFHSSERPNSMYSILSSERQIGNSRDFPHSDSNLVQHTSNDEKSFQQVDGAEKTVRSMVKHRLKKLSKEISLDRSTFKKIAKKATHTILDSFRIRHSGSAVSPLHEPPNKCSHELYGEKLNLVTGYCHPCLHLYVKRVVKMLVETL